MIDTSLDYAIHAVNGLSKKDMQNVVTHINEVLDMEQATTIQNLKAKVQELELKQNYKLLDEIIILRHRLKELEASNKRKRAKIKSMEQSKLVNHLKADAIEEMLQHAWHMTGWSGDERYYAETSIQEYANKLRGKK